VSFGTPSKAFTPKGVSDLSGTAEARALLHALSQGEAGGAAMCEAQESLDRLTKRVPANP
jgi:limonene-1,2-epoxide hydrolase